MKRQKKKGYGLMAMGLLCLGCALLLTLQYLRLEHQSDQAAQNVLVQLNEQMPRETEAAVENTPALIISDQMGLQIDWPMQESGKPMPWPVDQAGKPEPCVTDAAGRTYVWEEDRNRPLLVLPMTATAKETETMPVMTPAATSAGTIVPSDVPELSFDQALGAAIKGIATPTAGSMVDKQSGAVSTFTPPVNQGGENEGSRDWNENADLMQGFISTLNIHTLQPAIDNVQDGADPNGSGVAKRWPGKLAQQSSPTGAAALWTTDAAGNLLPYISDGQGLVIPWMTDDQGRVLKLELLAKVWELLLRQLNVDWQLATTKPAFVLNPDMEMPVMTLDGHDYIGILDIPSQELSLPIMSEWSYAKLRIAPCRYRGSVYSGDIILAGHNSNGHFSPIKKMAIGDEVRFTDMDGNTFIYTVIGIEVIGENDVRSMLAGSDEWDLSMFTCSHNSRKRTTIRCKLESYIVAEK